MKTLYMPVDPRKLKLANAIIEIDDERILASIEKIVEEHERVKKRGKPDFSSVFGTLTKEEADKWKKDIEDSFPKFYPNARK